MGVTVLGLISVGARTNAQTQFNAATTYKSKCVSCHGKKAEKKFDKTKADDSHVQVILKGKKATKPPHMPGYEAKGVTADQALALVTYMKSLQP
jgi:mono/diheme cytochrome c family protein